MGPLQKIYVVEKVFVLFSGKVRLHEIKNFYLTNINLRWWLITGLMYATLDQASLKCGNQVT